MNWGSRKGIQDFYYLVWLVMVLEVKPMGRLLMCINYIIISDKIVQIFRFTLEIFHHHLTNSGRLLETSYQKKNPVTLRPNRESIPRSLSLAVTLATTKIIPIRQSVLKSLSKPSVDYSNCGIFRYRSLLLYSE